MSGSEARSPFPPRPGVIDADGGDAYSPPPNRTRAAINEITAAM